MAGIRSWRRSALTCLPVTVRACASSESTSAIDEPPLTVVQSRCSKRATCLLKTGLRHVTVQQATVKDRGNLFFHKQMGASRPSTGIVADTGPSVKRGHASNPQPVTGQDLLRLHAGNHDLIFSGWR